MLKLGCLYQYRLAIHIGGESEELQKAEVRAAKKSWKRSAATTQEIYNRIPSARDTEGRPQTIVGQEDGAR